MLSNRSIPRASVIPVLAYSDVTKACIHGCFSRSLGKRGGALCRTKRNTELLQ